MSRQLIEAVLKWWEEHQHDTVASEEDEWNVYDEPPEFVQLALASQPAEQPRTFDRTIETPRRKQAVEKLLSLGWTYHHELGWIEPAEQARGEVVTFILDGVPVQIQGDRESLNLLMERIDETSDHVGNFAQPKHEQAVGDGVAQTRYTTEDAWKHPYFGRYKRIVSSVVNPMGLRTKDRHALTHSIATALVVEGITESEYAPRPAVATPAEVTDEYGPEVKVSKRCTNCKAMVSEPYRVQSDSGVDIYCAHPAFAGLEKGRKYIADSCRDTPDWCPAALSAQCQVRKDKTP